MGWAHHSPPFYTPWNVSSSPFPPCPVSRWPQALAEGLKTNTSLRELRLANNKIGDSGAQAPPLADGRGGGEGPRERQGSWRIGCHASDVAILRHFGCLDFDFDFDFGWIFGGNVWRLVFLLSCFQLCFPIAQLCCVYEIIFVMLRLFECVASKWDRPVDPETPARGEMSFVSSKLSKL